LGSSAHAHFNSNSKFQIGSSEFYVSKLKLNWNDHLEEAEKYGMTVSSIRSEEENNLIYNFIQNESENYFWLGATRNLFHSNLEWVDGSIFDFQDIVFGDNGNDNCTTFQVDLGGWINSDCDSEYYAIYRKIEKVCVWILDWDLFRNCSLNHICIFHHSVL